MSRVLGEVASSPSSRLVEVAPRWGLKNFRAGMDIQLQGRVGCARIAAVDKDLGVLHFDMYLSTHIPAAATGDLIEEFEIPCTRCRCAQCAMAEVRRSGRT